MRYLTLNLQSSFRLAIRFGFHLLLGLPEDERGVDKGRRLAIQLYHSRAPRHEEHPFLLRTGIQRDLRFVAIRRRNKNNVDSQRHIQTGGLKRLANHTDRKFRQHEIPANQFISTVKPFPIKPFAIGAQDAKLISRNLERKGNAIGVGRPSALYESSCISRIISTGFDEFWRRLTGDN
jgi:hypothetical protein